MQIMDNYYLKIAEKVFSLNILKELVNIKKKLYAQVNLHIKLNLMFILMKFKRHKWNKTEIIARKIIK